LPAAATRREWRIIGITSAGHALCHTGELVFAGILLALKQEFDLSPYQVTLLGLAGYVLMGVGAVPVGLWTDRWSARGVLTVYFFALALAATAVVLAPTAGLLAAALTGLGAALSLYHPAGLAMIAHGCRARGRAMGVNGVAGSLGVALGPALGMAMVSLGEWRLAYALIAGASLLSGIALIFLHVDESAAREARAKPADNGTPLARAVDSRGLGLLLLATMLGGFNYRCLLTALPTYLKETDLLVPGVLAFLVLALGGVGQIMGGHTADRVSPARLYVVLIAALGPLAILMAHGSAVTGVGAAAVLAIFLFATQPVENVLLAGLTAPQRRSTLYGVKFLLSFGLGALGAQLVGVVWEETGSLAPVFDVLAAGAFLMAGVAAWFRARRLRTFGEPGA
jgi:predicted MFS family arabinose efflux permease